MCLFFCILPLSICPVVVVYLVHLLQTRNSFIGLKLYCSNIVGRQRPRPKNGCSPITMSACTHTRARTHTRILEHVKNIKKYDKQFFFFRPTVYNNCNATTTSPLLKRVVCVCCEIPHLLARTSFHARVLITCRRRRERCINMWFSTERVRKTIFVRPFRPLVSYTPTHSVLTLFRRD